MKNLDAVEGCLYRSQKDSTETRCRYYYVKTINDRYFPECTKENCPILHPNLIEGIIKKDE